MDGHTLKDILGHKLDLTGLSMYDRVHGIQWGGGTIRGSRQMEEEAEIRSKYIKWQKPNKREVVIKFSRLHKLLKYDRRAQ